MAEVEITETGMLHVRVDDEVKAREDLQVGVLKMLDEHQVANLRSFLGGCKEFSHHVGLHNPLILRHRLLNTMALTCEPELRQCCFMDRQKRQDHLQWC